MLPGAQVGRERTVSGRKGLRGPGKIKAEPLAKYVFEKKDLAKTLYSASWAIVDGSNSMLLAGWKQAGQRELASCTKMITLYCVTQLCKRFNID
jgi:D-alanyl-D-alanine carboxypeptidase